MSATVSEVVIGTTLGPASDAVVEAGVSFARSLGARVRLLHALPPHHTPAEREERERRLRAQARRFGLCDPTREGYAVDTQVGAAHELLVGAARAPGAALVIGGRETAHWLGQALGSNAQRVLARAAGPVLLARGSLRDLRVVRRAEGAGPLGTWARRALLRRIGRSAGSVLLLPASFDPRGTGWGTEELAAWAPAAARGAETGAGGAERLANPSATAAPPGRVGCAS